MHIHIFIPGPFLNLGMLVPAALGGCTSDAQGFHSLYFNIRYNIVASYNYPFKKTLRLLMNVLDQPFFPTSLYSISSLEDLESTYIFKSAPI